MKKIQNLNVRKQSPAQDSQDLEQQFVSIQQHLQKFENTISQKNSLYQPICQNQRFQISNSQHFAQIPYQQSSAQIFRRPNHGQGFSNSKINSSPTNMRPLNMQNLNEDLVLNEQDFGNVVASYPLYSSSRQNCEQVSEFFPIKPLDLNVKFANNQQELQVQNLPNLQTMYSNSSQISNQPQNLYQNLLYQSFPQVSNYNVLSHQRHINYTSIVNGNYINDNELQDPFVNLVPYQGEFPQQIYSQEGYNNLQSIDFQMDQKFRRQLMNRQRIELLQKWQFQYGNLLRRQNPQSYSDYATQMQRLGGETEQFSKEIMDDSARGLYNWGANEKEGSLNMLFTKPVDGFQEPIKPVDISYYQPISANKYNFVPQISSQISSQSNSQEDLVAEENSDVQEYIAPTSARQRDISYYDYYDDGDGDDDDDDDYDYEDEMDEDEIEYLLESARQLGIPENIILSDRDFESTDYEALLMLEKCNVKIGATKQEIAQVPTTLVTNQNNLKEEQCTICMEGFCLGNHVKNLPCGHVYHAECIDTWLAQKPVCPVCGLNWKEFLQNQT